MLTCQRRLQLKYLYLVVWQPVEVLWNHKVLITTCQNARRCSEWHVSVKPGRQDKWSHFLLYVKVRSQVRSVSTQMVPSFLFSFPIKCFYEWKVTTDLISCKEKVVFSGISSCAFMRFFRSDTSQLEVIGDWMTVGMRDGKQPVNKVRQLSQPLPLTVPTCCLSQAGKTQLDIHSSLTWTVMCINSISCIDCVMIGWSKIMW